MTREPDLFAENDAIDEELRRFVTALPEPQCPHGISRWVVARVRRRRRVLRTGYAATAVFLLVDIFVFSFNLFDANRSHESASRLASNTDHVRQHSVDPRAPGLAGLDREYLAAPPPVVSLNLVSEDQLALLNYLESLDGDNR